jgi:hypothetical protein
MSGALAIRAVAAALVTGAAVAGDGEWCGSGAAIPDGGSLERLIAVPPPAAPQVITGVRVRLEGTHPWVGDLTAAIVHPSGLAVTLIDRPGIPSNGFPGPWGCGGDDFRCTLSDEAAAAIESTCSFGPPPVLTGSLRPNGPLAALVGLPPDGVWRIVVGDAVAGDAGSLALACLELSVSPDCNGNGTPDANDIASGASVDTDGDGVPDECDCSSDIDGDGDVDAADLAAILAAWGPCSGCPADLDGDGAVAATDLTSLLAGWGDCGQG